MSILNTNTDQLNDEATIIRETLDLIDSEIDREVEKVGREELEKHNYAKIGILVVDPITGSDEQWTVGAIKMNNSITLERDIHNIVRATVLKTIPKPGRPIAEVKSVTIKEVTDTLVTASKVEINCRTLKTYAPEMDIDELGNVSILEPPRIKF